ncbi:MAG: OPT/YSL family transporter [Planctomycetia bacterium]|nr:OPT/YSL family transporter [Planctomycetia bacterium]
MARPRNTDKVGPSTTTAYRELTVAGVVLGIVQGVILNLAFVYVALKLGFSICGSAVAAIMGYALLTGVMRRGTSLENNINQTIASGINTVGTGVVFTLPALFLLNAQRKAQTGTGLDFSITPILIGGVAGAILGTVFIIPLRKQMIELDRLRFPSGVAVTTIIRSGRAGIDKAKLLAYGFIVSMVWKLLLLSGWLDKPGVLEEEELLYSGNVAAAMVVGVAVCVAIGQAADMMQDYKTGFMLGAKPIKQQIVQFACAWTGVLLAVGAIYALWSNGPGGQGGFGEGTALPAPQATVLVGVIEAVDSGNVPVDKYVMGGTIGALLGAAPMPGLGVLIGLAMYLPFSITLGYGLGCLAEMAVRRAKGAAFCEHKLVPLAAGLIVGEALTGMGHALGVVVISWIRGGS